MRILGIDPGSTLIGFSLIEDTRGELKALDYGLITIVSKDTNGKLLEISREINRLIKRTKPKVVGLEKLFFAKNKKTAIEVAQARGVIALEILKKGARLIEITPMEVKNMVAGYGSADKQAVAKMANAILKLEVPVKEDNTADALAISIATSIKMKKLD